jgi:hypothetical protein
MIVQTKDGKVYEIGPEAVDMLGKVFSMHSVNGAFDVFAPDVSQADRYEVWDIVYVHANEWLLGGAKPKITAVG